MKGKSLAAMMILVSACSAKYPGEARDGLSALRKVQAATEVGVIIKSTVVC